MSKLTIAVDDLGKIIATSIERDLQDAIKSQILNSINPFITKLAADLARETSLQVESYVNYHGGDALFKPYVVLNVALNNTLLDPEQLKILAKSPVDPL